MIPVGISVVRGRRSGYGTRGHVEIQASGLKYTKKYLIMSGVKSQHPTGSQKVQVRVPARQSGRPISPLPCSKIRPSCPGVPSPSCFEF